MTKKRIFMAVVVAVFWLAYFAIKPVMDQVHQHPDFIRSQQAR